MLAMMTAQSSKAAAGQAAAALVKDGMVLGLGTGSTVAFLLSGLARRISEEGLSVVGVPTSESTATEARELGIPLTTLDENPALDLVIDGADEVDPQFRLIKGGGGALLREKIVAAASKQVVIIVGSSKTVNRLGATFLLPVEVLPFGAKATEAKLTTLNCKPFLRTLDSGGEPVYTDNGNLIFDCKFENGIDDPERLHQQMSQIPGVAELGLFINLCDILIEGQEDGSAKVSERD